MASFLVVGMDRSTIEVLVIGLAFLRLLMSVSSIAFGSLREVSWVSFFPERVGLDLLVSRKLKIG